VALSGAAAIELALHVGHRERQTRRAAVDDDTDRGPVRLAEAGDPQEPPVGITHARSIALRSRAMRLCLALTLLLLGCPMQTAPSTPPAPPPNHGYVPPPPAEAPADAAVGPQSTAKSCTAASDCESGVCEGLGCDDAHPGTCAPVQRKCTMEATPYCGCDGKTFAGSFACPGRRYASRGACPGS